MVCEFQQKLSISISQQAVTKDMEKHQRTLNNIREKYGMVHKEFSSYTTPVKTSKPVASAYQTPSQFQLDPSFLKAPTTRRENVGRETWASAKTSREGQDRASDREKQLSARMEMNERLLRKSKDLREAQNKKQSLGKSSKKPQITAQTITEVKLSLGGKPEPVKLALNQRVNRLEGSVHRTKHHLAEETSKATARFTQQLQEILDKNAAALERTYSSARGSGPMSWVDQSPRREAMPVGVTTPEVKVASVFENTGKVEERIHALLRK